MQVVAAAGGAALPLGDFFPPWSAAAAPAMTLIPFRDFALSLLARQQADAAS